MPLPGAALLVTAEGETLVEFARSTSPASHRGGRKWRCGSIAPTRPTPRSPADHPPGRASPRLTSPPPDPPTPAGQGLAGYQFRSSTNAGANWTSPAAGADQLVAGEGETLVELRAVDGAGNVSAWVQDIARIDRTNPTSPTLSGGSLSWQSLASVGVTAAGSTDGGGSSLAGYEYRSSSDGGSTWSVPTPGATDTVSAEGQTLVEFRALDGAGNVSGWAPSPSTAGSTVRLDRTAPTLATVSGGSLTWKNQASLTVTPGGGADTGGSGFSGYEYRTSTDGGSTWSGAAAGASLSVSAQGETVVQFRAVDGAGNSSAWMPAGPARAIPCGSTAPRRRRQASRAARRSGRAWPLSA